MVLKLEKGEVANESKREKTEARNIIRRGEIRKIGETHFKRGYQILKI